MANDLLSLIISGRRREDAVSRHNPLDYINEDRWDEVAERKYGHSVTNLLLYSLGELKRHYQFV